MTIGIVQSIFFDKYFPFWNSFFSELGINVLTSEETESENIIYEYCLGIKKYINHVENLKDKVDYVLVPKLKKGCNCYFKLHDIIKDTFDINLLTYNIESKSSLIKLGKKLGYKKSDCKRAYNIATEELYKKKKIEYLLQKRKSHSKNKKILIVGQSYFVNDEKLKKILNDQKIEILFSNIVNPDKKVKKYMYFSQNNDIFDNILEYENLINGIILITTYPCESNFELENYLKYTKRLKNIPIYVYEINKNNHNIYDFIKKVKGDIHE